MRVLLALDGSPSADAARQLVGSLAWPEGSVIDVVGVMEPVWEALAPLIVATPGVVVGEPADEALDRQAREDLERILDEAVAALASPTLTVRRKVLEGRPATLIVDAAGDLRAELVVVGSRGRGPLRSMVLGSVSAEVVDHAPCPVLVVRRPVAESVLLAVDGSASSQAAVTFLGLNRILAGRPVEVLSVAHATEVPSAFPPAGITEQAFEAYRERLREDRSRAEAVAAEAGRKLEDNGYPTRWSISTGDAAHEIIQAATSFGSGLIVMGSRGHTGLTRLLLGSVARNVLLHTSTSVLIVREPVREESAALAGADRTGDPLKV